MSMQLGNSYNEDDLVESHEINVTPFIDVMLVLLIIFMVAAPLATVDIPVDLPASNANNQLRPETPVIFTIQEDLSLALGDNPISHLQLAAQLNQVTAGDRDTRLFIRADKAVPYNELMVLMNKLRAEGYLKIGLVGLETTE